MDPIDQSISALEQVIMVAGLDPVALQVGPVVVRWYALAYIFGLGLGWGYAQYLTQKNKLWSGDPPKSPLNAVALDDFFLWASIGVIVGGRLGYVIFYNPAYYFSDPVEIVKIWRGGMSFHGGLIGVGVAAYLFFRSKPMVPLASLTDLCAASAPIGLLFGRIANFVNGELYGRVSDVSWAVVFSSAGPLPRHPSQLYEAFLEGAVLFAILAYVIFWRDGLKSPGLVTGLFLIGYGVARMSVELVREPDAHIGFLFGGMTMGMMLTVPMVLAGIVIIASRRNAA